MTPRARRILVPLIAAAISSLVVLSVFLSAPKQPASTQPTTPPSLQAQAPGAPVTPPAQATNRPALDESAFFEPPVTAPASTAPSAAPTGVAALGSLRAQVVAGDQPVPQSLGSLNPHDHALRIDLTLRGAAIDSIHCADIWHTAPAKRKAEKYYEKLPPGAEPDPTQLDEKERYILQTQRAFDWYDEPAMQWKKTDIPVFAAHSIVINGQSVPLLLDNIWREAGPGIFTLTIINEASAPVAEITRQFVLGGASPYAITIRQRVRNLSGQPLNIKWQQYGPNDLDQDRSGYIDRRRFDFGYLPDPVNKPQLVLSEDNDLEHDRGGVVKLHKRAVETTDLAVRKQYLTLWPNRASQANNYGLSWFASTNRYFGLSLHPPLDAAGNGSHSLAPAVEEIRLVKWDDTSTPPTIFTFVISPTTTIAPETEAAFDLAVYAGPLDRHILGEEPYSDLAMYGLILYRMAGGCCTFLTFQWLAHLLLWFLSFLHDFILFDWGLAIIGLVCVVRALLHPLTKKSQINMQRFGKQMGAMKPEIDKIQKKYKDDPKKAQQEQMRLMREHGVNPLQMLGCLPMFLQMPIWIALWAMLYLAFDIRQQPAFYGVFQLLWGWPFLGDLSSQDMFITLGKGFTLPLLGTIIAINLLPLLMGVVFFFQQKYMSPPPSPNMTPEQIQQQKIMKVMMVVMMPLFLYMAPSGLTLYIFTSSCIGILESRYIRRHIDEIDLNAPKPGEKPAAKKPRDARGRAFWDAIERAKAKRAAEPAKTFKKRKP